MFDFTLKYFFKEIKKNISMIGVITGAMLLLSLILSMFYNTTLNPPLKTDDLAAFFMELFRLTVILIFMLICIYVVVYSTNYYNKIHSKILGLLKIFGYTTKEIVLFFMIQITIILSISFILFIMRHYCQPLSCKYSNKNDILTQSYYLPRFSLKIISSFSPFTFLFLPF